MVRNTFLCVDLKTLLADDRVLVLDKPCKGILVRDDQDHFTFSEASPASAKPIKKHPFYIRGARVNIKIDDDGRYYLTVNKPRKGDDFYVFCYNLIDELDVFLQFMRETIEK